MAATGVLLAQLGSPDAPTPAAVRRYLAEFLSDRRVVDAPRWLWKPVLHGIVLRTRPKKVAALYRNVWTERGSPLVAHTADQAAGIQARLGPDFRVEYGMRVGEPSMEEALDRLADGGCRRVVVLPLFPQFSSATTGSVLDAVGEWARERRSVPSLVFVRSFADHPAWISAVVAEVKRAGVSPSATSPLLLSFHGLPVRYAREGDPYPAECAATVMALVSALNLPSLSWRLVFQSRFGREEWLRPYAFDVLEKLPREDVRSVSIVSPSFASDCLETIDEIGREGERRFLAAGGRSFTRIPCPNASPEALDALAAIVRENLPA